ncbi:MAG: hypothetical protein WCJ21_11295, partial [Planctomycetota bacterium]
RTLFATHYLQLAAMDRLPCSHLVEALDLAAGSGRSLPPRCSGPTPTQLARSLPPAQSRGWCRERLRRGRRTFPRGPER